MKQLKAFTLIEMLVVFGIISIITGMTVTSYTTSAETRNLEGEARRLVDTFNLAYKKGYSAETGPLAQCSTFTGYRLTLTQNTKQYVLTKCCNATCSGAQSSVVSTYTIPHTSVVFTAPTGVTQYLFQPLSVRVVVTPAANQTITLRNTRIGKCISLAVNSAGAVQENAKVNC